uniref:Serine/threonine-protein phosphatase n=1 Tax=Romanomermis culicivorax TaxID=13658 RepID=A0A915IAQ1_ROMCU
MAQQSQRPISGARRKTANDPRMELRSPKPPVDGLDLPTLNSILDRLLRFRGGQPVLTPEDIRYILQGIRYYFQNKPALLEIQPPVVLCGDTHAHNILICHVSRILKTCSYPPSSRYLFLGDFIEFEYFFRAPFSNTSISGDYVDRGPYSIETVCMMMAYKLRFPEDFHILRGNHETKTINEAYGFYAEVMQRYGDKLLWLDFQPAFDSLPVAGLIANKIFCMHGGLSPDLNSFDDIRQKKLPFEIPAGRSIWIDLLWADPADADTNQTGFIPNIRGVSFKFGEDVVYKFCEKMRIDMVVRAHQVVQKGYEFYANKKLVTLFSAPNYCGQFGNLGGAMRISENLTCHLTQVRTKRATQQDESVIKAPT